MGELVHGAAGTGGGGLWGRQREVLRPHLVALAHAGQLRALDQVLQVRVQQLEQGDLREVHHFLFDQEVAVRGAEPTGVIRELRGPGPLEGGVCGRRRVVGRFPFDAPHSPAEARAQVRDLGEQQAHVDAERGGKVLGEGHQGLFGVGYFLWVQVDIQVRFSLQGSRGGLGLGGNKGGEALQELHVTGGLNIFDTCKDLDKEIFFKKRWTIKI